MQAEREEGGLPQGPAILHTHPLTEKRLNALDALAHANGWDAPAEPVALPGFLER